jgi:hypothetical protein
MTQKDVNAHLHCDVDEGIGWMTVRVASIQ